MGSFLDRNAGLWRLVLWATSGTGTDKAEIGYTVGPTWTPVKVVVPINTTRTSMKLESYEDTANITYFYDSAAVFRV